MDIYIAYGKKYSKMSCFTKPRSAHTNIFLRTPDQSEHKKKKNTNKQIYIYLWGAIKPASKTLDYKMKLVGLVSLKLFQVVVILSRMYSKNVVMWKCEVADAHSWFLTHIPPLIWLVLFTSDLSDYRVTSVPQRTAWRGSRAAFCNR